MPSPSHSTRRAALAAAGAGLSALAGCSALPAPLQSRPDPIECDPLSTTWPTAGATPEHVESASPDLEGAFLELVGGDR